MPRRGACGTVENHTKLRYNERRGAHPCAGSFDIVGGEMTEAEDLEAAKAKEVELLREAFDQMKFIDRYADDNLLAAMRVKSRDEGIAMAYRSARRSINKVWAEFVRKHPD
jgi:hypothetical protein